MQPEAGGAEIGFGRHGTIHGLAVLAESVLT